MSFTVYLVFICNHGVLYLVCVYLAMVYSKHYILCVCVTMVTCGQYRRMYIETERPPQRLWVKFKGFMILSIRQCWKASSQVVYALFTLLYAKGQMVWRCQTSMHMHNEFNYHLEGNMNFRPMLHHCHAHVFGSSFVNYVPDQIDCIKVHNIIMLIIQAIM